VGALTLVLDHALPTCPQVAYRLVGTGAAMLHGVDLPVGDLDLLMLDRAGVDAFAAALAHFECLERPTWLPDMRQYYANYRVSTVEVGLSTVEIETEADFIETYGPGPWQKHYSLLSCGPYQVPTVDLELRLITEIYRDRPDRYTPLIAYLGERGCDLDLVRRGLSGGRLPADLVEGMLQQLTRSQEGKNEKTQP